MTTFPVNWTLDKNTLLPDAQQAFLKRFVVYI
ncbi:hypothetical protein Atep_28470 [Allochromatium tepidum]|uniref:Uncharacterized protein n=1 Tax=Allochromatium tepidum TaxID=553982 RepID=A0ABN6GDZ4_9GAMM|nr:hypothetical protein Atep_28470 [Allochromatium tepidum]